MNRPSTHRKIVERLREPYDADPNPAPPEGLRAALLSEVPERLELSPEVAGETGAEGGSPRWRQWTLAAAASLAVAIGAGVVAVRVMEEEPVTEPAPRRSDAARTESVAELSDAAPEPAAPVTPAAPVESPELAELETIPTARDPWGVVTQTPGVLSDRIDPGGNEVVARDRETPVTEEGPADERLLALGYLGEAPAAASPPPPPPLPARPQPTNWSTESGNRRVPAMREEARKLEAELKQLDDSGRGVPKPRARKAPIPDPAVAEPEVAFAIPEAAAMAPSTGGTTEPNDQPYGDVFFEGYGTNPFLDPTEDALSTFALDVDTGSYNVVRRYVGDGNRPPAAAVRVEEMVNAFDYGDPAPRRGDFNLVAEGSRSPFASGPQKAQYHLLRFGIKAREVSAANRKPAVLTFVVDVSGSMAAENRLELVKRSLGLMLDELRPDDRVGLVVYGSRGQVLLEPTGDKEAIRRAVDRLVTDGATNAEEGIALGYDVARRHFRQGAINRLILCSDGVANVGATGPDSILERVGAEARRGIELTTVGFGMGNYNDTLMERLADTGDGSYAYVDRLDEAERVFVENLTGTLQTIARDAKVQVEMRPEVVERYRLIGYENRDVPDEKFRDDTVDAGEVGAGHDVTALYELRLRRDAPARATAAVLRLRYRSADSGEVIEIERPVTVGEMRREWESAAPSLRLASVVAELAEILRGSYWAKDGDLGDLFRRAQRVAADFPGDVRVSELATMIGKLARMR